MKPRLTDEEIANLRELEAKATAGPWEDGIAGNWNVARFDGDDIVGVAHAASWNAALIVAMRNALTRLLDERDERDGLSRDSLTVRQAAKMRVPLDGADAQAMEHALTITERALADGQKRLGQMHEDNRRLRVENGKLSAVIWRLEAADRERKAP